MVASSGSLLSLGLLGLEQIITHLIILGPLGSGSAMLVSVSVSLSNSHLGSTVIVGSLLFLDLVKVLWLLFLGLLGLGLGRFTWGLLAMLLIVFLIVLLWGVLGSLQKVRVRKYHYEFWIG